VQASKHAELTPAQQLSSNPATTKPQPQRPLNPAISTHAANVDGGYTLLQVWLGTESHTVHAAFHACYSSSQAAAGARNKSLTITLHSACVWPQPLHPMPLFTAASCTGPTSHSCRLDFKPATAGLMHGQQVM
jgi:hypothetical protein